MLCLAFFTSQRTFTLASPMVLSVAIETSTRFDDVVQFFPAIEFDVYWTVPHQMVFRAL
jgi:hypothetical protein